MLVPSRKYDSLVYMGLARYLLRRIHCPLTDEDYLVLPNMSSTFLSYLTSDPINIMYKIDLSESFHKPLTKMVVLEKLKPFIGMGEVFKLIKSFLYLPINSNFLLTNKFRLTSIPYVSDSNLWWVLKDIILMGAFDREFVHDSYCRYIDTVFIPYRYDKGEIFTRV